MTAGWCLRMTRAAVFAAVCLLLAALGHVLMSGTAVPWWALASAAVVTGGAAWCLAGRERGLLLVCSVMVAVQTALHLWFSCAQGLLTPSPLPAPRGGMVDSALSTDHMASVLRMSDVMPTTPGAQARELMGATDSMPGMGHTMGGTSSAGMLAAHLLAALLCGLWLAYGERAAFRILRAVAGWLAAPLRLPLTLPAPPHRPRIRARRSHSARTPHRLLLVHAITSRGPPVGTAVV
ncbi:hypothetical protein [Streptomyces colonosanans]|uniref:PE-PGRS family protein n=1 Tax=Streptomyces colonosanans TaxID=1428652 RepID=A0A1S2P3I6_9ACTN|nr:hypothetical protein [Streptomyces colonosanans]OIJ88207.1 hypothetical protein BIV24_21740 [Streptomyces colonosanans]